MNSGEFPRTEVEGVSLPRMIMGTNWLMGWSHKGQAADQAIKERYASPQSMLPVFRAFLEQGVDALMGPVSQNPILANAVLHAQEQLGQKITIIDTPIIDVTDGAAARKKAQQLIEASAVLGTSVCMIHHSSVEKLVDRQTSSIRRIGNYTAMIRQAGMVPGATAHMPEVTLYAEQNGYDLQAYVQIFNCLGFLMQIEAETVASIINRSSKPVMVIKAMAAGRCTPYVGLTFAWSCIRAQDMVVVGCSDAGEVQEDVEISRAAIERRFPRLAARSSPAPKQDILKPV